MSYRDWLTVYFRKCDGLVVHCPECGSKRIEWRLVGDLATRYGFGLIWCGECAVGADLSRVQFPPDVAFVSMDAPDPMAGVPEVRLVTD